MPGLLKIALVTAVMLGAGSAAAEASAILVNRTGKSVWVTIYNWRGVIDIARCVPHGQSLTVNHTSTTSTVAPGMLVYIRGELKEQENCGGRTLSDTGRGSPQSVPSNGLLKTFELINGQIRR